jgi:hypothetical protein
MSINLLKRKPGDKLAAYSQPAKQWQKNAEDTRGSNLNAQLLTRILYSLTGRQSIHLSTHSDPDMPQAEVVQHFKSLKSGALVFNQSTLCRKIRERPRNDNPNALSSKRPRIVTRPDIERALILWIRHMESKREDCLQVANGEVIDVDDNARDQFHVQILWLEVGCMQYSNP